MPNDFPSDFPGGPRLGRGGSTPSLEQAAWYLNVKASWVYEAVRAGRLPCHRVGRHIRFARPMIDDWLADQTKL